MPTPTQEKMTDVGIVGPPELPSPSWSCLKTSVLFPGQTLALGPSPKGEICLYQC